MDVIILVTDIGAAAAAKEQGNRVRRSVPKAVIPAADATLRLNGALESHFADRPLDFEEAPMMTEAQWKEYLDRRLQGRRWQRWHGKTPTALISIVVIEDEAAVAAPIGVGAPAAIAPAGNSAPARATALDGTPLDDGDAPIYAGLSSIGADEAPPHMAGTMPVQQPAPMAAYEVGLPEAPPPSVLASTSDVPIDYLKPDVRPRLTEEEKEKVNRVTRIVGAVVGVILVILIIGGVFYVRHRIQTSAVDDYNKALKRCELAEEIDAAFRDLPPNTEFTEVRGKMRSSNAGQANREEALADLTEAIRIKPDYADAYLARADIYDIMGMKGKAEPDREKYKSLGGKQELSPVGIAAKKVEDERKAEQAQEEVDKAAAYQALRSDNLPPPDPDAPKYVSPEDRGDSGN